MVAVAFDAGKIARRRDRKIVRNAVEAAFARDRAATDGDSRGWLERVRPGLRDALRAEIDRRLAAEFPE